MSHSHNDDIPSEKGIATSSYVQAAQIKISYPILVARSVQYLLAVACLAVSATAIDRTLVSKDHTMDEALSLAAVTFALLVIPFGLATTYHPKVKNFRAILSLLDGFAAALLFAAFVLGAVYQTKNLGSCDGPAKIGVFDNHRACRKMKGAAVLMAVESAAFASSALLQVLSK